MTSNFTLVSQVSGAICVKNEADGLTQWRFVSQPQHRFSDRRPAPACSTFPEELRTFTYASSPDGTDANLLIMLHGLGDSNEPFANLAKTFALPQTACLSLRAPFPLPLELGHGWFEAIDMDAGGDLIKPGPKEKRRAASLTHCLDLLDQMLEALTAVGWQASEVFLFGFSQGGTVALEWALRRAKALKVHQPPTTTARSSNGANFTKTEDNSETAFGGVVAVAAGLLEERQWPALWPPRKHAAEECAVSSEATGTSLRMCACLLIAGKRDSTCPPAWIKRSAGVIDGAELEKDSTATTTATAAFFQKGHAMLGSPAEGQALMGWLAPRLKRLGAWESDPDVFHVS